MTKSASAGSNPERSIAGWERLTYSILLGGLTTHYADNPIRRVVSYIHGFCGSGDTFCLGGSHRADGQGINKCIRIRIHGIHQTVESGEVHVGTVDGLRVLQLITAEIQHTLYGETGNPQDEHITCLRDVILVDYGDRLVYNNLQFCAIRSEGNMFDAGYADNSRCVFAYERRRCRADIVQKRMTG